MSILKSKIIRNFVNFIYLFGTNATEDVRNTIITYLEKVFNYSLDSYTKNFLLTEKLSLSDINLFFRKYKYMLLEGEDVEDYERDKVIYEIARESINKLKDLEIKIEDGSISILKSFEILQEADNKNLIYANSMYGILYYNGIFTTKNINKANKYLTKNALWNDEFSILALALNYKEENDEANSYYFYKIGEKLGYIDSVETNLKNEDKIKIDEKVEKDYIFHKLLKDDRASNQYNMFIYNPNLIKILYDYSFDLTEKKALLFSSEKIDYSRVSALVCEEKEYNLSSINYQFRLEEQAKVLKALSIMIKNIKTKKEGNVPLIINCESKLIIDLYSNFINQYFENEVVKELDASRCDYNTLIRNYAHNNFLYQTMIQNGTNNVVIKYHNLHTIKDANLSLMLNLLNPNEKYYIQDLMTSIDKRKLINIIFVQDIHSLDSRILQLANIITLNKEKEEEKKDIVLCKFKIELSKKKLEYKEEYDKYVDKISEIISMDRIFEVVNEVVSKVSFEDDDVLDKIISKAKNSRTIGF